MSTPVAEKLAGQKRSAKKLLTPEEKKRQQRKAILKGVVIIAIAIFGTWGFYQGMILASGTQYPMVVVVSPSMTPHINVGDLLFVHYVPPADIKNGTIANQTGDVILYDSHGLWPVPQDDPIVHRVVGKYFNNTDNQWYFITKGDYNPNTDQVLFSSLPVPQDHVLGVVDGDIPGIGYVKIWLSDYNIAIPLMIILGALLFITIVYDAMHPEEEETKDGKKRKGKGAKGRSDLPPEGENGETPEVVAWGYDEVIPDKPHVSEESEEGETPAEESSPPAEEKPHPDEETPDETHDFV